MLRLAGAPRVRRGRREKQGPDSAPCLASHIRQLRVMVTQDCFMGDQLYVLERLQPPPLPGHLPSSLQTLP